jgi:SAM-dependent methyltransferase
MNNFNTYSQYYDLLYKDKDYQSETDYIFNLIKAHNPGTRTVLELGCGSGTHAGFLCARHLVVKGIERSESMVNLALQKNIPGFSPIVGDITSFSLSEQFDTAISLFHVISYLTRNTELLNCFTNTSHHLKTGGIFIFDVWYSPAVYAQKPETRIKRMENDKISVTRIAESEMKTSQNTVNVHFEVLIRDKKTNIVETLTELHPMRHFSIPEIELVAQQTGFKVIRQEEFLTGKLPGEDTWGVCFVLQKQ